MDVELREGDLESCAVEGAFHFLVQDSLAEEDFLLGDVCLYLEDDARIAQLIDSEIFDLADEDVGAFFFDLGKQSVDLFLKKIEVGGVGDADLADSDRSLGRAVDDVRQIRVVYDLDVAAGVAEAYGADADRIDHASETVDLDDVADIELVLKEDEDAGDDVGNQALGSEPEDEGYYAEAGKDGADVDAEDRENDAESGNYDSVFDKARRDVRECELSARTFLDKRQQQLDNGVYRVKEGDDEQYF